MGRPGWTAGPWRACKNGDCTCGFVWSIPADAPIAKATIGEWGDEIAVIGEDGPKIDILVYGEVPAEMGKANARLISAAPDLAEAALLLELAEDAHANCPECDGEGVPELCPVCFPLFDDARLKRRAALAKARGEPSP